MAFKDIEQFRENLKGIPETVINGSMTNVLWTILSYSDGCFIGEESLMKICRVKKSALRKNIRKLTDLGLIRRETPKAYKGRSQRYWVNMERLNALADSSYRVDIDTPIKTQRVDLETPKGVTMSLNGSNQIHPQRYKNTQISSNEDFEIYLKFIPTQKKPRLSKELVSVLDELLQKYQGTLSKVIEDHFYATNWHGINIPNVFVLDRLRELNARPIKYSKENPPAHCGECDPIERVLLVTDENGDHRITCRKCNWFYVNQASGY